MLIRKAIAYSVALLTLVLTLPPPARADSTMEALGLCSEVERYANTLVDYTETKCLPARG